MRRITLSMVCALPLCGLPAGVWAQGSPAGLRACAAESNPERRLSCYDRAMGRSAATPTQAASGPVSTPAAAPAPTQEGAPAASERAAPAAAGVPREVAAPPAPKVASGESAAPRRRSRWKILSAVSGGDWHETARVARLERSPDSMVLHLDNGQVWRQIGRASGDLGLHAGDSVTIEKHLGSYWLSSRYISNMKVRQEPQG